MSQSDSRGRHVHENHLRSILHVNGSSGCFGFLVEKLLLRVYHLPQKEGHCESVDGARISKVDHLC